MPLKTITGNLLDMPNGLFAQQVNTHFTWGHGLARQFGDRYPDAEKIYQKHTPILGECFLIEIPATGKAVRYIANLYGQIGMGGPRATHYGYLGHALAELSLYAKSLVLPVYIPWRMSSDLAGGDWTVVEELIEGFLPHATIVKLPAYNRQTGRPV
jgi:hypothetical protein